MIKIYSKYQLDGHALLRNKNKTTNLASVCKKRRYDWICIIDEVRIPTDLICIPRCDCSTVDKADPSSSIIGSVRARQANPYLVSWRKYLNKYEYY